MTLDELGMLGQVVLGFGVNKQTGKGQHWVGSGVLRWDKQTVDLLLPLRARFHMPNTSGLQLVVRYGWVSSTVPALHPQLHPFVHMPRGRVQAPNQVCLEWS